MTEIQGLEGIAGAVTNIDLEHSSNGAEPEPSETKITLVTEDGAEHDITEVIENARNDFDGDDANDDLNADRVTRLPGANGDLFDSGSYVDVPVIDGQATDTLVIAFGGSIKYEASDRAGQDLFNDLRLGKSVTLRVEGVVVDKKGGYKVNAAEEEIVTGTARIKVETLYLPAAEQL